MTKILAFSGKKQAGKNSAANQLVAIELTTLGIVRGKAIITPQGEILISDLFGDESYAGILDVTKQTKAMRDFRRDTGLDESVRLYSFADSLKQDICIKILGLSWEQCYGTDEQKNSITHLKWENMPGVVSPKFEDKYGNTAYEWNLYPHEPGPMTAREVMQFVGTELFRKMYADVWANATINKIKEGAPLAAIITDCRFPNEVEAVKGAGGKVMRFTRDPYKGQDQHESEGALDPDKFDWKKFDWVVDNANMNLLEQMEAVYSELEKVGWVEPLQIITE